LGLKKSRKTSIPSVLDLAKAFSNEVFHAILFIVFLLMIICVSECKVGTTDPPVAAGTNYLIGVTMKRVVAGTGRRQGFASIPESKTGEKQSECCPCRELSYPPDF
jgi:hypothetical protein